MLVTRIVKLALICSLLLGSLMFLKSATASEDPLSITYRIERNGKKIGRHKVDVQHLNNGDIQVNIAFKIRVKFAFITAFKMDHQATEVWSADGKLLQLNALTERSSGRFDVALEPQPDDGFLLTVNEESTNINHSITPTSFAFPAPLFTGETQYVELLDTLSGNVKPSTIHPKEPQTVQLLGRTQTLNYYEITNDNTGEITHRIWLDDDLVFMKLGLFTKDGHYIEYYRETT